MFILVCCTLPLISFLIFTVWTVIEKYYSVCNVYYDMINAVLIVIIF